MWLNGQENVVFFQRTQVQFLAPISCASQLLVTPVTLHSVHTHTLKNSKISVKTFKTACFGMGMSDGSYFCHYCDLKKEAHRVSS